jgi:hypothetical protein
MPYSNALHLLFVIYAHTLVDVPPDACYRVWFTVRILLDIVIEVCVTF